ncbi:AbrB/MazE/SpoVT family DNA-binding domain-containing protein [Sphingomonas sp. ac-8]|uniref:AbrB/MazE/SpoVT family DNA-binding domain-containing protein n=1 Tax=Sphingomonas sp. ac-8 TaxID=3242977 RepID=UPI003A80DE25
MMNIQTRITDEARVNMTSKGQVLLPKVIRDKLGLVPGSRVRVGINDRGEAVVLPDTRKETPEERRARIEASIRSVAGTLNTGMTTDEMMRELRGDDPFV